MLRMLRTLFRPGPSVVFATLALAGALTWSHAHAQTTSDGTPYLLEPPSAYNVGCYGPCDCAVRSAPMIGGFHLRFLSVDPLFTTYAVEDFRGSYRADSAAVDLHGVGEYRIGGEFALTQQLRLTLEYPDGTLQRFDSGLVPGGAGFPAIRISAAAHGFACTDTVIDVVAKPLTAGVPTPNGARPALLATPNPFRNETTIECILPHPARISLAIVDLQGREVVSLARGLRLDAGAHALPWDGRNGDRSPVRAGVYLAILHLPGSTVTQRLVRLE